MNISAVSFFQPRIQVRFAEAGIREADLRSIPKYSAVLERFHLITPHALQLLDRDPALLRRLNDHLTTDRALSGELAMAVEAKGLMLTVFGDPAAPIFYGLSGTCRSEILSLDEMGLDFSQNPTLADINVCMKAMCGIAVEAIGDLSPVQAQNLSQLLSPETKVADLLQRRGVERIFINYRKDYGIQIFAEEGLPLTVHIPGHVLSGNIKNIMILVIGALA